MQSLEVDKLQEKLTITCTEYVVSSTNRAFSRLRNAVILFIEVAVSVALPLFGFMIYMDYAKVHGIVLKSGCEGPAVPFGMMSGFLFALIQRFKTH